MIDGQAIQELVGFQSDGASVLSLYLNVDPHRRTREKYKLALRRLLESVAGQADPRDIAQVERYIDLEYNRQGRAVACFSCQARDYWRPFPLLIPREDLVFVGDRPYVKPLTDIMDRYAVALVNREGARLFVFYMGALQEAAEMTGEDIKRHRAGGWAAQRYQRHEDQAAQRNLREAAELTTAFCRQHKCDHLILGGTEINVAQFEELLPEALRERVVGHVTLDKDAAPTEVGERSLEAVQTYLARREAALVDEVITTAAKGGAATVGLADTLGVLHAGRLRHLVVEQGFRAPAYRCEGCGYMTVEPAERCTFCGGRKVPLPDAVDSAIHHAISQGAEVTVMDANEALQRAGQIGALLRY
jgi:peptide subunit release factor 1 (eRF1)